MKKYVNFTLILLVVIIGISFPSIISPNLGRSFHHTFAKSIDLSDEVVEELKLYDNVNSDKIISLYGKQTKQSQDNTMNDYFELRNGFEVIVNSKGDIIRFIARDKDLETAKGIKPGDSGIDVKNEYGSNYYYRREQGVEILGYVDKTRNTSIEFWMYDNKVVLFRLDDTSMM